MNSTYKYHLQNNNVWLDGSLSKVPDLHKKQCDARLKLQKLDANGIELFSNTILLFLLRNYIKKITTCR